MITENKLNKEIFKKLCISIGNVRTGGLFERTTCSTATWKDISIANKKFYTINKKKHVCNMWIITAYYRKVSQPPFGSCFFHLN